jgi:hypothetical protein
MILLAKDHGTIPAFTPEFRREFAYLLSCTAPSIQPVRVSMTWRYLKCDQPLQLQHQTLRRSKLPA